MKNSLFSVYSQNENRVTSTMIAVFERLNTGTLEFIFNGLLEDGENELITFKNQVTAQRGESVPDAKIAASFEYLFEVKIKQNTVDMQQLKNHLNHFDNTSKNQKLIVITPDNTLPEVVRNLKVDENRIYWFNFNMLRDKLALTLDEVSMITERETYLIEEFIDFILTTPEIILSDINNQVVIIPAVLAYDDYYRYSAYICQANRNFRSTGYLGFYCNGEVKKELPKILAYIDSVGINDEVSTNDICTVDELITKEEACIRIGEIKKELQKKANNDEFLKIVLLSSKNSKMTKKLANAIENDKKSSSGKNTAFTQKQVYVTLDSMKNAKKTSELDVI